MDPATTTGARIELSDTHHEWGQRLAGLGADRLGADVDRVRERAEHLSIWSRGGMVPVQPFVLQPAAAAALQAIGRDLHRLVVRHALSVADGDLRRLADHVHWPEAQRWVLDSRTPLEATVGSSRADVMVSGGVPRVLEVNVGTCLNGSTSTPVLTRALLDTTVGREVADRDGVRAGDFLDGLATWLLRGRADPRDRVALLSSLDASEEGSTRWAEHQARALAARGVTADLVPIEEIDVDAGVLGWGGHRYPQAVRYFMLSGPRLRHRDAVVALERAGGTAVYGGNLAQLFTSKALLADLSQLPDPAPAVRDLLAHVPWTARLGEGPVRRDGRLVDPVEWAAGNRDVAVLKPFHLFGSRGVTVGRHTDEDRWRQRLGEALAEGDHVVQELVEPDTWSSAYVDLADGRLVTVDAPVCLGPFDVAGADGGILVQQPVGGGWPGLPATTGGVSLGTGVAG